MLPFDVKLGTTAFELFTEIIPRAHRQLVPKHGDREALVIHVSVEGDASCSALHCEVRGADIVVTPSSGKGDPEAHLYLLMHDDSLRAFLEDWGTDKKYLPKFSPKGASIFTDPRVLRRLAHVTGSIELALPNFPGGRASLRAGAFGGRLARVKLDRDPDVTVESSMDLFDLMLTGAMRPEEALSDSRVTVTGKKMVALQFAFALAPFMS
ncbi:MAG: SCP2 sterol-binding domain-containing protein [Polyangiaceae bacterium]